MEEEVSLNLVEDKEGKAGLNEHDLIKIRKEKILALIKKDVLFSGFLIAGLISLLFSFFVWIGLDFFINAFSFKQWLILGILFFLSAGLVYINKKKLAFYPILVWIVWTAVYIRTRNLDKLRDVTTGTWTLGPDLDPFLFLRWAKYIVENGSLFAVDTMRYVPFGFETQRELLLHPYLMAWFHKIAVYFGSESVTHSAVIYPVFMFALTLIAFFLFVRKAFIDSVGTNKANIIGLIAALLFSMTPVFLPRTIAGIPEKESAAFLFMFLAFYFFISAWRSKGMKAWVFAILAGASSAGMAHVWGGYGLIFLAITPTLFIMFLIGRFDKDKIYVAALWLAVSYILMALFSLRYSFDILIKSQYTGAPLFVLLVSAFDIFVFEPRLKNYFKSGRFSKFPQRLISLVISFALLLIILIVAFGPSFIKSQIEGIEVSLLEPATSRFILTVAESKQPFLVEWWGSFGPFFRGQPILFWLFFIGMVYAFYKMMHVLRKKDRIVTSLFFLFSLFAITFSRYSGNSKFNGGNTISLIFYSSGFIALIIGIGYYYYVYLKKEEERLKGIDIGFVLVLTFSFLTLLGVRTAIRLIMLVAPPAAIIVSYLVVEGFSDAKRAKDGVLKITGLVIAVIFILSAVFVGIEFYKQITAEATYYAPSVYTAQWQKAMAWVRDNTQENAVFGHWWDYGYWIQSIGERATVLDGGNAQGYWNHMMGRYALTGPDNRKALEFLYAHNTTHFLIDSTDIGKYSAFSSIGSDKDYDRVSWLSIFIKDNGQVMETKNSTIFVYTGGTNLDEDLLYEENGRRIFLPSGNSGIGAILIERDSSGDFANQPLGIFFYQGQQIRIPLRYAYYNGEFRDFGNGIEAGVYIFPKVEEEGRLEFDGALIYLSRRTVKSQLARLYLYKENNPNFRLVYSEDDFIVSQIRAQNPNIEDIMFYNGLRGPIRIWEIKYPDDIEFKEEYLSTYYPKEIEKS